VCSRILADARFSPWHFPQLSCKIGSTCFAKSTFSSAAALAAPTLDMINVTTRMRIMEDSLPNKMS
jgi:hypothetical protein